MNRVQAFLLAATLATTFSGTGPVRASETHHVPPPEKPGFRLPSGASGIYDFQKGVHTLRLKQTVEGYFVGVILEPKSLGNTPLLVVVRDAKGKPVTDAQIGMEFLMPAHPHMGVDRPAVVHTKDGVYRTVQLFSMEGEWQLVVALRPKGRQEALVAPFSITLVNPPPGSAR